MAQFLILSEVRNRIAFITLNRPAALNALSLEMIVELRAALKRAALDSDVYAVVMRGAGEKAFCAGGDIRALYDSYNNSGTLHRDFFIAEYPLDYLLHSYPKPYMALMDGITMGGGMGVSQGSRLRIVGDRTRIAMPEVAIGFFPDVGASYFLSRLPGALGPYLALTGVQIRAADALYTGLADFYLPSSAAQRLDSALAAMLWSGSRSEERRAILRSTLQGIASDGEAAGTAPLAALRPAIDQHFAAPSIPAVFDSLQRENRGEYQEWAAQTLALMNTRSPTMLEVTHKQLHLGKSMTLAECLRMELGMVWQCFNQGDFVEGIRALVIDKDNKPQWRPARIAEVTEASVAAIFKNPWADAPHPLAQLEGVNACN
jgi:enoyl-CoA hydratase/carnithine racemase